MLRQFHDTNVNILRPGMNGKVKQDLTQNQDRYFVFLEKVFDGKPWVSEA